MLVIAVPPGMNPIEPPSNAALESLLMKLFGGLSSQGIKLEDDGKTVVKCKTMEEYAEFRKSGKWIISQSTLYTCNGKVGVSTVLLQFDHGRPDKPLYFETMVFGGRHDEYQRRYATREEAEAGHREAVEHNLQCNGKAGPIGMAMIVLGDLWGSFKRFLKRL